MKQTQNQFYGKKLDVPKNMAPGSTYVCVDEKCVFVTGQDGIPQNILINNYGENILALNQTAENYSSLIDGDAPGNLIYVKNTEGTVWLPGGLGGDYYPSGWYVWNGLNWISDRNSIANQFKTNIDLLNLKVNTQAGYSLTQNDLTDSLKINYDTAVSWVNTNGANVPYHLTNIDNPHGVSSSQVGLGNVDNTSDADKPISDPQNLVLNSKADKTQILTNVPLGALFTDTVYDPTDIDVHLADQSSNPHSIEKDDLGLGSVDNTSDVNKPTSLMTQEKLDYKVSETFIIRRAAMETQSQINFINLRQETW